MDNKPFDFSLARKVYPILIIPVIIILLAAIIFGGIESTNKNHFINEYRLHTHSIVCDELVCTKTEHTHSSSCRTCGYSYYSYYYHTHSSSCYCSKEEHSHNSDCYAVGCEFSKYDSANAYATANYSKSPAPFLLFMLGLMLIAFDIWVIFGTADEAETVHNAVAEISDNFFNPESDSWLKKLRAWIIIFFYLEVITFIIIGFADSIDHFSPAGYGLGYFALIAWSLIGLVIAILLRNVNMIILQYLQNVNTIRENTSRQEADTAPVAEVACDNEEEEETAEEAEETSEETSEETPEETENTDSQEGASEETNE